MKKVTKNIEVQAGKFQVPGPGFGVQLRRTRGTSNFPVSVQAVTGTVRSTEVKVYSAACEVFPAGFDSLEVTVAEGEGDLWEATVYQEGMGTEDVPAGGATADGGGALLVRPAGIEYLFKIDNEPERLLARDEDAAERGTTQNLYYDPEAGKVSVLATKAISLGRFANARLTIQLFDQVTNPSAPQPCVNGSLTSLYFFLEHMTGPEADADVVDANDSPNFGSAGTVTKASFAWKQTTPWVRLRMATNAASGFAAWAAKFLDPADLTREVVQNIRVALVAW